MCAWVGASVGCGKAMVSAVSSDGRETQDEMVEDGMKEEHEGEGVNGYHAATSEE